MSAAFSLSRFSAARRASFAFLAASTFLERVISSCVFAFDLDPTAGPGLTFMTMPIVFAKLPMGQLFAVAFYLCLVLAALTSAVSLLELVAAYFIDELRMPRFKAVTLVTFAMLVVGSFCGLSFGVLSDFKIAGRTIFDNFDYFTSNLSLPVGGIVVCALAGVVAWKKVKAEILLGAQASDALLSLFRAILVVASPVLIFIVLVTGL